MEGSEIERDYRGETEIVLVPKQIAGRLRYGWNMIICHETMFRFMHEEKIE